MPRPSICRCPLVILTLVRRIRKPLQLCREHWDSLGLDAGIQLAWTPMCRATSLFFGSERMAKAQAVCIPHYRPKVWKYLLNFRLMGGWRTLNMLRWPVVRAQRPECSGAPGDAFSPVAFDSSAFQLRNDSQSPLPTVHRLFL